MKIDITLASHKDTQLDRTNIYNIVKRSEEDLLRRMPNLKEFSVAISAFPHNSILAKNIIVSHQLSDNESALTLIIKHHKESSAENINRHIADALLKIKQIYN